MAETYRLRVASPAGYVRANQIARTLVNLLEARTTSHGVNCTITTEDRGEDAILVIVVFPDTIIRRQHYYLLQSVLASMKGGTDKLVTIID